MPAFWALTGIGAFSTAVCNADSPEPNVSTPEWVAGPGTVSLGKIGEIKIPAGYRFTGAEGARSLLQSQKSSIPAGLQGCMVSADKWMILFEYTETGYLPEPGQKALDKDAILATFLQQYKQHHPEQFKGGRTPLSWELPPSYDAAAHTVEWSIRAKTDTSTTLNYNFVVLGRRGMLHVITIYQGATDLDSFRQLAKSFSFRSGEQYADHQEGDKVAGYDLAGLVTLDTEAETIVAGSYGPIIKAVAIGVAILLGIGFLGVLLVGKMRQIKLRAEVKRPARPVAPVPAAAVALPDTSVSGTQPAPENAPLPVAGTPAPARPRTLKPRPEVAQQPKPTPRPALNNRRPMQRRMMFDYNRYFTDLMSTVSNYASLPEPGQTNGHSVELDKNGATAAAPPPTNGHAHPPTAAAITANAELIAHQITFIEEQRRLMQEQSKLIEEKSKLIAEKNHLLKLQAELMEQKLL